MVTSSLLRSGSWRSRSRIGEDRAQRLEKNVFACKDLQRVSGNASKQSQISICYRSAEELNGSLRSIRASIADRWAG